MRPSSSSRRVVSTRSDEIYRTIIVSSRTERWGVDLYPSLPVSGQTHNQNSHNGHFCCSLSIDGLRCGCCCVCWSSIKHIAIIDNPHHSLSFLNARPTSSRQQQLSIPWYSGRALVDQQKESTQHLKKEQTKNIHTFSATTIPYRTSSCRMTITTLH
jgi:hypothetical protein